MEFTPPTGTDSLNEVAIAQKKKEAFDILELQNQPIANSIRTLWGYKECVVLINKLIMNGGDGVGSCRIGFSQAVKLAILKLGDLHEAQFATTASGGFEFTELPSIGWLDSER